MMSTNLLDYSPETWNCHLIVNINKSLSFYFYPSSYLAWQSCMAIMALYIVPFFNLMKIHIEVVILLQIIKDI